MTRNHQLDDPAVRKEDDAFNRWPFSKRLADTIANFDASDGAPVIGIYGKWGSGKTSVLNFLNSALKEHHPDKVVLHPFNPWLFKDHETLLQRFFAELFKAMEKSSKDFGDRIGKILQDYSGLFGLFPGFGAGSKVAEQAGKALTKNMEQVRDEVREMMKKADRKVVVLIDDLDRLDRDEILQMLKVVRLTANFPNVVYLLAFDDEMVGRAIAQKYGNGTDSGRQFLEKIVQYPYTLPAVTRRRLMEFVENQAKLACEHAAIVPTEEDWKVFRKMAHDCLSRRLTTPRQAIRYGNALRFALPMIKGEVNILDQMAIEGLRVLYPELWAVVRDNKESFALEDDPESYPAFETSDVILTRRHVDTEGIDARVAQATQKMTPDEAASARALVDFLFKRRPVAPQGVVRSRYFDRYFSYAIANDEIGDTEINALIEDLEDKDSTLFAELLERNAEQLLQLLLIGLPNWDMKTAAGVARLLARHGPGIQALTIDPRHGAFVIAHLVLHVAEFQAFAAQSGIKGHDGCKIMQLVGRDLEPISLALKFQKELDRAARKKVEEGYNQALVREADWKALSATLAERLAVQAGTDWRSMMDRPKALPLLAEWGRLDPAAQREWLAKLLRDKPESVGPMLRMCVEDTSELSFSVNESYIQSLIEISALTEAARNAAILVDNPDDAATVKAFLAWRDKRKAPDGREPTRE